MLAGSGDRAYADDIERAALQETFSEPLDEEEAGEDVEEEEEEERRDNYPLPPLPPVTPPPLVQGIPTAEVYSILKEIRRQLDDPVERERVRRMLQNDTNVLLAVAQVLQESHLLRRTVVNDLGVAEEQFVPQPEAPPPPLPTGYSSWIVEETSAPGGRGV